MAQMGQQQSQSGMQNQMQSQQLCGQGAQLTDRDILQLALNENKHLAASLNTYILEANSEQLRRDYMTVLGDLYSQNKQVYDLMQQKGYYNVQNASQQQMSQAQSKFSGSQNQTQM